MSRCRWDTAVVDPACVPDVFTDECAAIDVIGPNVRLTFVVPRFEYYPSGERDIEERLVVARLVIPAEALDRIARMIRDRRSGAMIEHLPPEGFSRLAS